jgi:hypothetical protein
VTVAASPDPGMDDKFLPTGWNMTGGLATTNADGSPSRTKRLVDCGQIGTNLVTATSGCSSKSLKIIVLQPYITNQCIATTPANQARTTIGVGEEVNLWLVNPPCCDCTWSTSAGTLSVTNGTSTTFTAPDTNTAAIITVYYNGDSCSKPFDVIQPIGLLYENDTTNSPYMNNCPTPTTTHIVLGYYAFVYAQPDTVNFGKISLFESKACATTNGFFVAHPPKPFCHPPNGPNAITSVVIPGKGTFSGWHDMISGGATGFDSLSSYSNGSFTWPIVSSYAIGSGSQHSIQTVNQTSTLVVGGTSATLEVQKGNSGYKLTCPSCTAQPIN